MKRIGAKLLLTFLTVILLSTCSLPPYDEGLSLGLETARKMVELGAEHLKVGPVWAWDFDFRNREYYFMPSKGFAPDEFKSGFIVSVDERSFELSFVEYMGGPPDNFEFYHGWNEGITNDNPDSNNYFAETVKGAGPPISSPFLLNFIRYEPKNYRNNQLRVIQWPPPPPPPLEPETWEIRSSDIYSGLPNFGDFVFDSYNAALNPDLTEVPVIVGSSITAADAVNYDDQYIFCRFPGGDYYAEFFYPTDPSDGINTTAPTLHRDNLDFNFPDEVENGFYHYVWSMDLSFFSYYSKTQRKYKNYRWGPGAPSAVLTPLYKMDRRIDTALSNGDLLSFDNNRCYVYNSEGKKQYDFLMGGLHFCYEIYLGGLPHVIFTLPAALTASYHEDELYFYVYALPTDLLRELQ